MKEQFSVLCKSIIAGVCIGLGCAVYSKIGGIEGAVLFATGLITIIHFRLPLFTGIVANRPEWSWIATFLGNVGGAALAHFMWKIQMPENPNTLFDIFLGACGTGVLMVAAYKSKSALVAIFGVALFIMSGFSHCIAEAGYLRLTLVQWVVAVLGNFVGGQLWRLLDVPGGQKQE